MTSWPQNPNLLVVAERGTAKVVLLDISPPPTPTPGFPQSGVPQPAFPLLDLSGIADVPDPGSTWTFQFGGLTGFTFHPRFSEGRRYRYIFVRYNVGIPVTAPLPGQNSLRVVIERYAVAPGTLVADPASRTTIFDEAFFTQNQGGHFSGALHFDPRTFYDGTGTTQDDEVYHLFAPMGDMVSAFGPDCQDLQFAWYRTAPTMPGTSTQSLLAGKLLRFEIGPGVLASGPGVPPVTPVILGHGLRNPYAFSFDRGPEDDPDRGDLWICDTGSFSSALGPLPGEIVRLSASETSAPGCGIGGGTCRDFGWPWVETVVDPQTFVTGNIQALCWNSGLRPPSIVAATSVDEADLAVDPTRGSAVLGGIVYRGTRLNQVDYAGRLFYGTFANMGSQALIAADRSDLRNPSSDLVLTGLTLTSGVDPFGPGGAGNYKLVGFGEDTDGELYLIRMDAQVNSTLGNGTIYRIDQ